LAIFPELQVSNTNIFFDAGMFVNVAFSCSWVIASLSKPNVDIEPTFEESK